MQRDQLFQWARPLLCGLYAPIGFFVALAVTVLFPGTEQGKFLSDRGLVVLGLAYLVLLLAATSVFRFRWWDCLAGLAFPIFTFSLDFESYWHRRILIVTLIPILASALFAAIVVRPKPPASGDLGGGI